MFVCFLMTEVQEYDISHIIYECDQNIPGPNLAQKSVRLSDSALFYEKIKYALFCCKTLKKVV